jgi:hypothetical protein
MSGFKRVLAFDIGIRNLAWCFLEKGEKQWSILGWENYDLIAGSSSEEAKQAQVVLCETCKKKGTHTIPSGIICCRKHCPPEFPPIADLSGNLLKKIPALPVLKILVGSAGKKFKKSELVEHLRKKYSMPIERLKATKAIQMDLGILHGALQKFVSERADLFRTANRILLENQPAFKNPTMKSIQILLFATLRERVLPGISVLSFVHAGKKTKGSTGGDKGYAERKKASEARVEEWFKKSTVTENLKWLTFLKGNQKKNDLCDTLCMCLDALEMRTESI